MSICPKDFQRHDGSASSHYALVLGESALSGQQAGWRRCGKCESLFFAGNPAVQGICARDRGPHDGTSSAEYLGLTTDRAEAHDGSGSDEFSVLHSQYMLGFDLFEVINCRSKGDHNDVDTLIVVVSNDNEVQPPQRILLGDNLHKGDPPVRDKLVGPFFLNANAHVTITYVVMNSGDGNAVENTAARIFSAVGKVLGGVDLASEAALSALKALGGFQKVVIDQIVATIVGVGGFVFGLLGDILGHSNPDCSGAVIVRSFAFDPGDPITLPSAEVVETQGSPHECGNDPHSTVRYALRRI